MSKWATIHTYATGLANAMKAFNDNDIETMNMHLGLLDRMIQTQTLGTNLELAKMRLASQQQVNPIALQLQYQDLIAKILNNKMKMGEIQDKEELDTYIRKYAQDMVDKGLAKDPETALLMLKNSGTVQGAYNALRTIGQVGAELETTAPTGESLYKTTTQADLYKSLAETERRKAELETGLPGIEAKEKAVTAQTNIQYYPRQEAAKTSTSETEARYREELLKSEIQRNLASARFLDPNNEARQWLGAASMNLNRAAEITSDIARLEEKISSNAPDLGQAIAEIAAKHNVAGTSSDPRTTIDQLRYYRDTLEKMAQSALDRYHDELPQATPVRRLQYGLGPYKTLAEMRSVEPNKYNMVQKELALLAAKGYVVETVPYSTVNGRYVIGVLPKTPPKETPAPAPAATQKPIQKQQGLSDSIKSEFLRPFGQKPAATQQKPPSSEDIDKLKEEIKKKLREGKD